MRAVYTKSVYTVPLTILLQLIEKIVSLAQNPIATVMGTVYTKSAYTVSLTTINRKDSIIGSESYCHSNGNGVY